MKRCEHPVRQDCCEKNVNVTADNSKQISSLHPFSPSLLHAASPPNHRGRTPIDITTWFTLLTLPIVLLQPRSACSVFDKQTTCRGHSDHTARCLVELFTPASYVFFSYVIASEPRLSFLRFLFLIPKQVQCET